MLKRLLESLRMDGVWDKINSALDGCSEEIRRKLPC